MFLRKLLIIILLLVNSNLFCQICSGRKVILVEDGNCELSDYELEFEENFEGQNLDTVKWELQQWQQGAVFGQRTQEYNSIENIIVDSGYCNVILRKELMVKKAVSWKNDTAVLNDGNINLRPFYYSSSNIWSKKRFGFGKYEIRCKVPSGKGFWPAFWLFGDDSINKNSKCEIDVFEFWGGNSSRHHMTLHKDGNMCESDYLAADFSNDFHIFSLIWDRFKIEWYVDGKLKRRTTKFYSINAQSLDCNQLKENNIYLLNEGFPNIPMNIIFNVGIENGKNEPDKSTVFPSKMKIDYIKYYSLKH